MLTIPPKAPVPLIKFNLKLNGSSSKCFKKIPGKEGLAFARDLSQQNSAGSYLSFRLTLLHLVSYIFFLYQSPSLTLCPISSNINEVVPIKPSGYVFVFGVFNVHHKDWLTYSGETDRPGELCFSISNDLNQMVTFPTQIPDYDSPAILH